MALRLPRWETLSKDEQIPIINLSLNKTYVVTGGPGTGKTVMAIHRAAKWKAALGDKEAGIKFLVFNKPLMRYLKQALAEANLTEASAENWHPWFYRFYRNRFQKNVPEIAKYRPDWEKITPELLPLLENSAPIFDHLIIDEAQDLPKELLTILKYLCKNATIFADERQSLDLNSSSIADITNAFDAGGARYFLNRNYRNTQQIADLAQLFYSGHKDDLPAKPKKTGDKPRLIKASDFESVIKLIATYGDNNPEQNIGVLLPNNSLRQKYYEALIKCVDTVRVQKYISENNSNDDFNFDADGIKLLTYWTMKGLEFDALFLPEIDDKFFNSETTEKLNYAYVGMTRAKDRLDIIYSDSSSESFILSKIMMAPELVISEDN